MTFFSCITLLLLVFAENLGICNGQDDSVEIESSFTEMISLTSYSATMPSSLPDMDSFTVSQTSATYVMSETSSLPDLDGSSTTSIITTPITTSTPFIAPTSTTIFVSTSTTTDCGPPPSIANGQYQGGAVVNPRTYSPSQLFNCDAQYELVADQVNQLTCHPTGNWAGLPSCLINCGPPGISNGQYDGETYAGSSGNVICNPGRVHEGPQTIQCETGTGWSQRPQCVYDCGTFDPPMDGYTVSVECTYGGCEAVYDCDEGFTLSGSGNSTCVDEEGWNIGTDVQLCQPIDCGTPTPAIANGNYDVTNTLYPAEILIGCQVNHVITGVAKIDCQIDGTWTTLPQCIYDCGQLETPENGQIETDCTGVSCVTRFQCDDGFTRVGQAVSTCVINQGWTSQTPVCAQDTESSSTITLTFSNPPPTDDALLQQWRDDLTASLTQIYRAGLGSSFNGITINSISPNGTVLFDVVYDGSDENEGSMAEAQAAMLANPIKLLGQAEPLASTTIGGETFTLADVASKDDVACAIYQNARGSCASDTQCIVANNKTICEPVVNDNWDAIIGLTIGVLVFLILAPVVLFAVIVAYKRRRMLRHRELSPPSSTVSIPPMKTNFMPVTFNNVPLRYNTIGRAGSMLYGSDYPEQWSNPASSIKDDDSLDGDNYRGYF